MTDDTDNNIVELPAPPFQLRPLDPEICAEWDAWKDLMARWHKSQHERIATDDDDGTLIDEETAIVREMAQTPASRWQHILAKVRVYRSLVIEDNIGHKGKWLLASIEADLEHRYD